MMGLGAGISDRNGVGKLLAYMGCFHVVLGSEVGIWSCCSLELGRDTKRPYGDSTALWVTVIWHIWVSYCHIGNTGRYTTQGNDIEYPTAMTP